MRPSKLVSELAEAIKERNAVLVAGAGVSIAATQDPIGYSWLGLLRNGIRYCEEHWPDLTTDWSKEVERKISSGDTLQMIEGAQALQEFLRERPGNHFRKWLSATVGSATAVQPGLLRAIADLAIPIATTNYDDLLIRAIGGDPVTWKDPAGIQRVLRGGERGVIHIHGHWRDMDSVVLGVESYDAVIGHEASQEIVKAIFATKSVIFAGFGLGLDDPNFSSLRSWIKRVLAKSESDFPPTLLVRRDELAEAEQKYGRDGVQVLAYGDAFEDLELFVADLQPRISQNNACTVYNWPSLQMKLNRLNRRIRRDWDPQLVITLSGPGSFASNYCMTLDPNETPTVNAVTFPKTLGRSSANNWFSPVAVSADWAYFGTKKWDVFIPDIVKKFPSGTRVLVFDDRVVGGNMQTKVAAWLKDELGFDVRRAAIVVHPQASAQVDWYEDVLDGEYAFPWGGSRGRS